MKSEKHFTAEEYTLMFMVSVAILGGVFYYISSANTFQNSVGENINPNNMPKNPKETSLGGISNSDPSQQSAPQKATVYPDDSNSKPVPY